MSKAYILIDESPSETNENFIPEIYDLQDINETIPENFNAVKITIDGRADGSLNWKLARTAALNAVGQGKKILWNLDLGLPNRLQAPITDQTQFLTLGLSLDHFRDTLWKELQTHTIGLCLYEGNVDFKFGVVEESLFFSRNAIAEYLDLLAQRVPDIIPLFVMFDTTSIEKRFLLTELISKESFHRFQRFVTDGVVPARCITGKQLGYIAKSPKSFEQETASIGICIPALESNGNFQEFEQALEHIIKNKKSYRFIPESSLTTEWDGLDYLLVKSDCVSVQGLRKLKGFCAAGGEVLTLGGPIGVPNEQEFSIFSI